MEEVAAVDGSPPDVGGTQAVDAGLNPPDSPETATVEELRKELDFYKSENERKERELAEITQVCRAVMEKLHVLTCHINDKEKEDEVERDSLLFWLHLQRKRANSIFFFQGHKEVKNFRSWFKHSNKPRRKSFLVTMNCEKWKENHP